MEYRSILRKIGFAIMPGVVLLMHNSCSVLKSHPGNVAHIPVKNLVIHNSFSSSVVFAVPPDEMGSGWGAGFIRREDLGTAPFDRPQTEEFRLPVGEKFSLYLILASKLDEAMKVLVTVLLDYKQVSFELDGKVGILHKLELSPNVEMNLPMNLSIDLPGAHDLIVIAFADPDYHPVDNETRLLRLEPALAGRRAVVIIGDNEYPFKNLLPDMLGKPIPKSDSDYLRVALATGSTEGTDIPPADRQFIVAQVHRDEKFSFQVIAKNEEKETVKYAIVTFLDFHQVVLDGDGVLLADLDTREEATYDGTIPVPNVSGVHELQVVYILDPYKSILQDEVTAPFVFGSVRVGLQIP